MPFVEVITKDSGTFSFRCSIATPSSPSAEAITPGLPCIVFIHSCFIAQEIFELQFADPFLRKFNLIAIDMRGFGETQGWIGEGPYTPAHSANDVEKIMEKLNIPPSHMFGLSNGCSVVLELAIARPDLVLSLVLCSPLPPVEPAEIYAGRMEVFEYWNKMAESREADESLAEAQEFADEVMNGSLQLLYNHENSNAVRALSSVMLNAGKELWQGSPEKYRNGCKANIEWILERRSDIANLYPQVKGPVNIIHCTDDVAYPVEYAEELEAALEKAQVSPVVLHRVSGPHFANVTNPQEINKILYDIIVDFYPDQSFGDSYSADMAKRIRVQTPCTDYLVQSHGYDPFEDLSDESGLL